MGEGSDGSADGRRGAATTSSSRPTPTPRRTASTTSSPTSTRRTARRWRPSATCRRSPSPCSAASIPARWTSPIPCGRRRPGAWPAWASTPTPPRGWLAHYGTDWVVPGDGDGRRLEVLEEQGIHAEVTLPGPDPRRRPVAGHVPRRDDRQGPRGGVAGAARLRALAGRLLRRRPGATGRLHADRLPRHGPRRRGGGVGPGQRHLRRRDAARHVGHLQAPRLRRRLLRAVLERLRGARDGGQPAHRRVGLGDRHQVPLRRGPRRHARASTRCSSSPAARCGS